MKNIRLLFKVPTVEKNTQFQDNNMAANAFFYFILFLALCPYDVCIIYSGMLFMCDRLGVVPILNFSY